MASRWVTPDRLTDVGLFALVAVLYSNVSDALLRHYPIPSPLQVLIAVLAVAVFAARKTLLPSRAIFHPLTAAVVVYTLIVFASSVWAADVAWADQKAIDVGKGLAVFLLVVALAAEWRSLRGALIALVVVATLLAGISVAQIAFHQTWSELGGMARIETGTIYGEVAEPRAAGPLADPNFYGQILLMALPVAFFLGLGAEQRRARVLCFGAALAIAAGTLATYSRGAMLTAGVMVVLVPLLVRVRIRVIASVVAVAVVILALIPLDVARRLSTFQSVLPGGVESAKIRDSSVEKRRLVMATGMRMFDEHLLLGVGAGNFGRHYSEYANQVGSSDPQYDDPGERQFPHNLYVEIAAETGLAGLVTFGLVALLALGSLWRSRALLMSDGEDRLALLPTAIIVAIVGYLVSSLFLHSAYQRYLWLMLAFAPAIARVTRESSPAGEREVTA